MKPFGPSRVTYLLKHKQQKQSGSMTYKANPTNIVHEAETGMFEANVTIESDGCTTCHVVQVPGPISMPYKMLRPALIRAAGEQRKAGRFDFRVTQEETPGVKTYRQLFTAPSLLDSFLGRAA
jgi:hypothetical protein